MLAYRDHLLRFLDYGRDCVSLINLDIPAAFWWTCRDGFRVADTLVVRDDDSSVLGRAHVFYAVSARPQFEFVAPVVKPMVQDECWTLLLLRKTGPTEVVCSRQLDNGLGQCHRTGYIGMLN